MNIILVGIIIANVIISYKGFNDLYFFRKHEFHVGSIRSGEQMRMLSSGFLHVDIMHLAFNMLTLWFFAPVVLNWLGTFSFVLVYFGSLIFGSLLTMLFHKNDYSYDVGNLFCNPDPGLSFRNFIFIIFYLRNESKK